MVFRASAMPSGWKADRHPTPSPQRRRASARSAHAADDDGGPDAARASGGHVPRAGTSPTCRPNATPSSPERAHRGDRFLMKPKRTGVRRERAASPADPPAPIPKRKRPRRSNRGSRPERRHERARSGRGRCPSPRKTRRRRCCGRQQRKRVGSSVYGAGASRRARAGSGLVVARHTGCSGTHSDSRPAALARDRELRDGSARSVTNWRRRYASSFFGMSDFAFLKCSDRPLPACPHRAPCRPACTPSAGLAQVPSPRRSPS